MDVHTDLLRRLESGFSLPTLSVVAIRLVELASDEECSVNDLVSLIEKDPSLAIRLLKIANSAFFKSAEPVTTLRQAVIRIGFQQLRIMALSLSLSDKERAIMRNWISAITHYGPLFITQGYVSHGHCRWI